MSETLEERIRRIAKEDSALGMVNAFASDIIELLDDRDETIRWLSSFLKNLIDAGIFSYVDLENDNQAEIESFVNEIVEEYGRYTDESPQEDC